MYRKLITLGNEFKILRKSCITFCRRYNAGFNNGESER